MNIYTRTLRTFQKSYTHIYVPVKSRGETSPPTLIHTLRHTQLPNTISVKVEKHDIDSKRDKCSKKRVVIELDK